MKTTIQIDTELLDRLKEVSINDNITLENLIEISIINFLVNKGFYGEG